MDALGPRGNGPTRTLWSVSGRARRGEKVPIASFRRGHAASIVHPPLASSLFFPPFPRDDAPLGSLAAEHAGVGGRTRPSETTAAAAERTVDHGVVCGDAVLAASGYSGFAHGAGGASAVSVPQSAAYGRRGSTAHARGGSASGRSARSTGNDRAGAVAVESAGAVGISGARPQPLGGRRPTSRARLLLRAVAVTPAWDLSALTWRITAERALRALGFALYIAGSAISGAGFWRLGKFTYLPEYFGIFCDEIITSFPFNLFADPMYLGSALMHFGYALMHLAPTGLFLAVILSLAYWIAARLFEEPFMNKLYAQERKRRRARALRSAAEPETGIRERAVKGASGRAPAARAVGEPGRA
eukprot:ctg_874.g426